MTATRVLVVDDEPFICTTVSMLLRLAGYSVASAADGRAGLQLAQDNPPDIILSDLNMPHMDGYALLAAVRGSSVLRHTRFVLLTGAADVAPVSDTGGLAPDACLAKPFTREQLLKVLRQVQA